MLKLNNNISPCLPFGVNKNFCLFKKNIGFNKKLTIKKVNKNAVALTKLKKILGASCFVDEFKIKTSIINNINYLKKIRSYRGLRHVFFRPTRGQRTHTNAKTVQKIRPKKIKLNKNI